MTLKMAYSFSNNTWKDTHKCNVTFLTQFILSGTMRNSQNNIQLYYNVKSFGRKMCILFKQNSILWTIDSHFQHGLNRKFLCHWMMMLSLTVRIWERPLINGKVMLLGVWDHLGLFRCQVERINTKCLRINSNTDGTWNHIFQWHYQMLVSYPVTFTTSIMPNYHNFRRWET